MKRLKREDIAYMKYVQIDCVGTVCTARMGLAARDGTFVWGRESLQAGQGT